MRGWGMKQWIVNYWLKRMDSPFSEPYSIRQAFYKELPEIIKVVPDRVKASTPWAKNFYNWMTRYLSRLVLNREASYRTINVYDDSGASSYILQNMKFAPPNTEYTYKKVAYPIEVWVENNASYNSLLPLFDHAQNAEALNLNLISQRGNAKTQQLEKLMWERSDDVKVILNLTDFDPSGYNFPWDLQNRIDQIGLGIKVEHIGILPDQIPVDRKSASLVSYAQRDPNLKKFLSAFGNDPLVQQGFGYEIQALEPSEIRTLTLQAIKATVEEYKFEKRSGNSEE